jgi:hypothetical protein
MYATTLNACRPSISCSSLVTATLLGLACGVAHGQQFRDANGNVGYATAAECDAAIANGTAVFYKPYTCRRSMFLRQLCR